MQARAERLGKLLYLSSQAPSQPVTQQGNAWGGRVYFPETTRKFGKEGQPHSGPRFPPDILPTSKGLAKRDGHVSCTRTCRAQARQPEDCEGAGSRAPPTTHSPKSLVQKKRPTPAAWRFGYFYRSFLVTREM